MNLPVVTSPISTQQSPAPLTKTHPHSLSMRNNNPTSPRISSTQLRLATAQDGSPLDLDGGTGADIYSSCLEQIRICAATIQSCAEHQKRMTDDVLQLSRLRSHKLAVENVYYRPWDMVQTTLRVFRVQADKKVIPRACSSFSIFFFLSFSLSFFLLFKLSHLFGFRDWNCDLNRKDWTSARRYLGTV